MAISHLLRQTITVKNPTGSRDLHGNPTLGSAATLRARFERTYKTIVTPEREREPIHAVVFVGPATEVEQGAQITYSGEVYRVIERSDVVGRNGQLHHYELMCQLWSFDS